MSNTTSTRYFIENSNEAYEIEAWEQEFYDRDRENYEYQESQGFEDELHLLELKLQAEASTRVIKRVIEDSVGTPFIVQIMIRPLIKGWDDQAIEVFEAPPDHPSEKDWVKLDD